MDITRIIGCRYFKAETVDNSVKVIELYKVVGLQNETTLKIKDLLHEGNNIKINKAEFEDNYILLEPDAYVLFSTVYLQDNLEDIIVSMFRTADMSTGSNRPYCVCRQNIVNMHGAMIRTQDLQSYEAKDVGMCMSIETIMDGFDYNAMTACNGMKHFTMVAAYMDDKLSDMLQCLKLSKFDTVLSDLFNKHVEHVINQMDIDKNESIHMGYCKTLKDLLEYNSFMYDFRRAFGISEISIDLSCEITEDGKLTSLAKDALQRAYNRYILDELVIKFEKDIDINDIKQNKIMVCDANESIYIVTYTEGRKYIEDVIRSNTKMNPTDKLEAIFNSTPQPSGKKVPDLFK